jgi:hypothetical protein
MKHSKITVYAYRKVTLTKPCSKCESYYHQSCVEDLPICMDPHDMFVFGYSQSDAPDGKEQEGNATNKGMCRPNGVKSAARYWRGHFGLVWILRVCILDCLNSWTRCRYIFISAMVSIYALTLVPNEERNFIQPPKPVRTAFVTPFVIAQLSILKCRYLLGKRALIPPKPPLDRILSTTQQWSHAACVTFPRSLLPDLLQAHKI